jgi:hypothetical protein
MFFVWWIVYGFMKSPIVVNVPVKFLKKDTLKDIERKKANAEATAWKLLLDANPTAWWCMQGEPKYKLKKFQNHAMRHKSILDATKRFCGDQAQRPAVYEKLPVLVPKEVY